MSRCPQAGSQVWSKAHELGTPLGPTQACCSSWHLSVLPHPYKETILPQPTLLGASSVSGFCLPGGDQIKGRHFWVAHWRGWLHRLGTKCTLTSSPRLRKKERTRLGDVWAEPRGECGVDLAFVTSLILDMDPESDLGRTDIPLLHPSVPRYSAWQYRQRLTQCSQQVCGS